MVQCGVRFASTDEFIAISFNLSFIRSWERPYPYGSDGGFYFEVDPHVLISGYQLVPGTLFFIIIKKIIS